MVTSGAPGRVLVVGAGIAGLAAATELAAAGADVTVLEATDRPGGRIHSMRVNGCVFEAGANFLASGYRVVPELAATAGVELRRAADGAGYLVGGRLYTTRGDDPSSSFRSGLLPWTAFARVATGMLRVALRHRDPSDLAAWTALDDRDAISWGRRTFGRSFTDGPMRAAFNGFYFADLAATSATGLAAVASYGAGPFTSLTVDGGLSRITDALAARLDVRYGVPVLRVEASATAVRVHTGGHEETAEAAIIAVPGKAAAALLPDAGGPERELLTTPYSHGMLVALGVAGHVPDDALGRAYGLLIHPDEPGPLAAVAVASRAGHAAPNVDLLTCFFTDSAALALSGRTDEELTELARRAVTRLGCDLAWSEANRVVRIPQAMPTIARGRSRAVAAYRQSAHGRVLLAGDYLAFPWTDSAAAAGRWAARRLLG